MQNKSINTVSAEFSDNIILKFLKKFWYIMTENQTKPTGSSKN